MIGVVLKFVGWLLAAISFVAGLWVALWAVILDIALYPEDTKWLVRSAGFAFTLLWALYWFPIGRVRTTKGLVVVGVLSGVAAFAYAGIYNRAELNDPFRSENEFGATQPFQTASVMCIIPFVRLSFAWISRRIMMPNQSSEPTLSSGTSPAGQEPRLP